MQSSNMSTVMLCKISVRLWCMHGVDKYFINNNICWHSYTMHFAMADVMVSQL